MSNTVCLFVYLPGAGAGEADLTMLRGSLGNTFQFEMVDYPGWRRYVDPGFSAKLLVAELAEQISAKVPQDPILIAGASLGGHFAYAAALQLQRMGREIGGLCAIDTFMIASSGPSEGWQSRALDQLLDILRKGRLGKFTRFARSRFWRAVFRLAGGRLTNLVRASAPSGRLPWPLAMDPIAEEELSMRLLLRAVAPWVASLDRDPVALNAPAILLRTPSTAGDDAAWRYRCPNMKIVEIPGQHLALYEPENIGSLRDAFITATREWCQPRPNSLR
jgi:thioesterase domain-containing protein